MVAESKKARKRRKEAELRRRSNMLQSRPDLNMNKRLPDSLKDHLMPENGDKQADELPCRLEEVESLARTEEVEPLLVRIVEVEPMQVEEGGDGVVHNQQQVERDLDEFERTDTIELDIDLEEV